VQYAPQAFGFRGANLGFCRWVRGRACAGDAVRVMFHEPWVPFGIRPRRIALAAATRWMAHLLLSAARHAYVSVPAWEGLLRPWAPGRRLRAEWLPIPATIPVIDDPARVAALRDQLADGRPTVGHFGTYGREITRLLEPALVEALTLAPEAVALLVGRGADAFAYELRTRRRAVADRIVSRDASSPDGLSAYLQAMDVALQPYPDGATARRTTLMAALANRVAVVTHPGRWSEPIWTGSGLALANGPAQLGAVAARLLRDPAERAGAAAAGWALYDGTFALRHTLDALLGEAG
jgi:glycosyltransferase involved in cell wall biosynthesis